MGRAHSHAYLENNVHVVAVVDNDQERTKKLSDELQCRGYSDYDIMFEHEHLDVVSICTPVSNHKHRP